MNNESKLFARKHPVLATLGILFGFFIAMSFFGKSSNTNTSVTSQNQQEEKKVEVSAKSYQQVFAFKGTNAKKSEPFTISGSRFKVKYDCTGDLCIATLYKVGSSYPIGLIMNGRGPLKDETVMYGAGEYYIDANVIGNFSMIVEDYK